MNTTTYSENNRLCIGQRLRTDSKSTVITGDGALESDPEFTEKNYKFSRYQSSPNMIQDFENFKRRLFLFYLNFLLIFSCLIFTSSEEILRCTKQFL